MKIHEEALAGKPLSCEVIDAHTHIGAYTNMGWYQYKPELKEVIAMMDRCGINTIVTAPHAMVGSYYEIANKISADAIKKYPGKIMAYLVFNPIFGVDETKKQIKQYFGKQGFVGFKFLAAGRRAL